MGPAEAEKIDAGLHTGTATQEGEPTDPEPVRQLPDSLAAAAHNVQEGKALLERKTADLDRRVRADPERSPASQRAYTTDFCSLLGQKSFPQLRRANYCMQKDVLRAVVCPACL